MSNAVDILHVASSLQLQEAPEAKDIAELLKEYAGLLIDVAQAKACAGDFCKPPFDGSITTAIKALACRASRAERDLRDLKERINNAASEQSLSYREERLLLGLIVEDAEDRAEERLCIEAYKEFTGLALATRMREIAQQLEVAYKIKTAEIPVHDLEYNHV